MPSSESANHRSWVLGLIQCAYRPAFKHALYWYLERYENRATAETDKGPHGTVVESLGKIWLMSIDEPGREPTLRESVWLKLDHWR
jgi:hypothetical protein